MQRSNQASRYLAALLLTCGVVYVAPHVMRENSRRTQAPPLGEALYALSHLRDGLRRVDPVEAPPLAPQITLASATMRPVFEVPAAPPVPTRLEFRPLVASRPIIERRRSDSSAPVEAAGGGGVRKLARDAAPTASHASSASAAAQEAMSLAGDSLQPGDADVQAENRLQPLMLNVYLDALQDEPACAAWAASVRRQVERLVSQPTLDRRAIAELSQLCTACNDLLPGLENEAARTALRRAQHALERRLIVWDGASKLASTEMYASLHPSDAELDRTLAAVDGLLAGAEHARPWREFLLLDALRKTNKSEEEGRRRSHLARQALLRFRTNRLNSDQRRFLDSEPLAQLQASLKRVAAETPDVHDLANCLEEYEWSSRPSRGKQLADRLHQLALAADPSSQELARQLEERYRPRNLRCSVSTELLNRLLPKQSTMVESVNDTILGMPVYGRSSTDTELSVRLLPGQPVRLELLAEGNVSALTSSQSGIVTTSSASQTRFVGRKVIELRNTTFAARNTEIEVLDACSALCNVRSPLDNLPLLDGLVQNAAHSRYQSMQDELQAEVRRKVAARARQRIDREAEPAIESLNQRLKERVLGPLTALGLEPEAHWSVAGEDRLQVQGRLAATSQLGAHTPRPRALQASLASLQLHETAANNLLESLRLHDQEMTAREVRQRIVEKLKIDLPLSQGNDDRDAIVCFASEDPITVKFRDGRIELCLRLAELRAERYRWRDLEVYVTWALRQSGPGLELAQSGPVEISGESLSLRSQVIVRGIFSSIFPSDSRRPILSDLLTNDARFQGLETAQLIVQDGWVSFCLVPVSKAGMQNFTQAGPRDVQLVR